ncbi:nucleolar protein dao-5-like [Haliotis cracherodii]|uniref:nucleolar protein dao-5-like n=1 Tax=Haliotis cracherodii TaxID=6455 RepID=UPI0039E88603
MEEFVKNLIKESDLSVLTTKGVRKAYEKHTKKQLSHEEKQKLKELVSCVLDELFTQGDPTRTENKDKSSRKSSVKKTEARTLPRRKSETNDGSKLLSPTDISDSNSKVGECGKSPKKEKKTFTKPADKDVETEEDSNSGHQNENDEDFEIQSIESNESGHSKSVPLKLEIQTSKGRKKMDFDNEQKEQTSQDKISLVPKRRSVSPRKQTPQNSSKPLPAKKMSSDNQNTSQRKKVNSQGKSDKPTPTKKFTPVNKTRKRLSISEVMTAMMDSDKDGGSDAVVASESDGDVGMIVPKKTNRKRKAIQSEDEDSDVENTRPKKKSVQKPASKKQKVYSEDELSDSDDDRLQIDIEVSTPQEQRKTSRSCKRKSYALSSDSESERESTSSRVESVSSKISDAASEDSGVNVDLSKHSAIVEAELHKTVKPSAKTRTSPRKEKKKEAKEQVKKMIHEETVLQVTSLDSTDDEDDDGRNCPSLTSSGKYRRRSGIRKNSLNVSEVLEDIEREKTLSSYKKYERKVKEINFSELLKDVDDETPGFSSDPSLKEKSVFSISETESDNTIRKNRRGLFQEFEQRNIAKILEGESFDVKTCTVVLERVDDQIDWMRMASRRTDASEKKTNASEKTTNASEKTTNESGKLTNESEKVSSSDLDDVVMFSLDEVDGDALSSHPMVKKLKKVENGKSRQSSTPCSKMATKLKKFDSFDSEDNIPLKPSGGQAKNNDNAPISEEELSVKKKSVDKPPVKKKKRKRKYRQVGSETDSPVIKKNAKAMKISDGEHKPLKLVIKRKGSGIEDDSEGARRWTVAQKHHSDSSDSEFESDDEKSLKKVVNGSSVEGSYERVLPIRIGLNNSGGDGLGVQIKDVPKGKSRIRKMSKKSKRKEKQLDMSVSEEEVFRNRKAKKQAKIDSDSEYEISPVVVESDDSVSDDNHPKPTRVSPRKSVSELDVSPTRSTRSRTFSEDGVNESSLSLMKSVSPTKSKRSPSKKAGKTKTSKSPSDSEEEIHEISEAESDRASREDSVRSLDLLILGKKHSKSKKQSKVKSSSVSSRSSSVSRGGNSDINSGGESDVSSIIQTQGSVINSIQGDSDASSHVSSKNNEVWRTGLSTPKQGSALESDSDDALSSMKPPSLGSVDVRSEDSMSSLDTVSAEQLNNKATAKSKNKRGDNSQLTQLRRICRCAGIFLRNTVELLGCDTDDSKIYKIKEILRTKGMQGAPSMKKAEILKLKKEAAELDTDNIISDSGRAPRRKVQSRYKKRGLTPSPSPQKKMTPLKMRLAGLKGIIDSEGSDSD